METSAVDDDMGVGRNAVSTDISSITTAIYVFHRVRIVRRTSIYVNRGDVIRIATRRSCWCVVRQITSAIHCRNGIMRISIIIQIRISFIGFWIFVSVCMRSFVYIHSHIVFWGATGIITSINLAIDSGITIIGCRLGVTCTRCDRLTDVNSYGTIDISRSPFKTMATTIDITNTGICIEVHLSRFAIGVRICRSFVCSALSGIYLTFCRSAINITKNVGSTRRRSTRSTDIHHHTALHQCRQTKATTIHITTSKRTAFSSFSYGSVKNI